MDSSGGTGDGAQPEGPRPIRPGPVIGGIVLGVVLAVALQVVLTLLLLSNAPIPMEQTRMFMLAVFLVPGVVGAGLLLGRRTRQMGAGLVLGLSVGAIVAAGVCTTINAVANRG